MILRAFWGWYLYRELKELFPPEYRVDPYWHSGEFFQCLDELDEWSPNWRNKESDEDRVERIRLVLQHLKSYSFIGLEEQFRTNGAEKMHVLHSDSSILEDYAWLINRYPQKFVEFSTFKTHTLDTLDYLDVLRAFVFNDGSPPEGFRDEVWRRVEYFVRNSGTGLTNVLEHHALQLDPPSSIPALLQSTLESWDELPKRYANLDSTSTEDYWAPTPEQRELRKKACAWALNKQLGMYIHGDPS